MSKVIQTVEELDAVLHWRGKHAVAIKERDALQQRLTAADERADMLEGLLRRVVDSSVLSFEQDAPEELESLEADICAALKPAEGGGDDKRKADFIRLNSAPHCPECGHPDCNGQCFGDDMMGD